METYFTTKELSEYLKIPEQSIRRWVLNHEIPFHRIHNVIRYRLSEIETWIGNNKNKLTDGADNEIENSLFKENADSGEMTETAGVSALETGGEV